MGIAKEYGHEFTAKHLTQLSEEVKISATILRYFNVSGADEKMRSGLMSNPDNLIKAISQLATKKKDKHQKNIWF